MKDNGSLSRMLLDLAFCVLCDASHVPRAWTLASELLARLAKQGIDPLRDRGVREALKRLVKDSISIDGIGPKSVAVSVTLLFMCAVGICSFSAVLWLHGFLTFVLERFVQVAAVPSLVWW